MRGSAGPWPGAVPSGRPVRGDDLLPGPPVPWAVAMAGSRRSGVVGEARPRGGEYGAVVPGLGLPGRGRADRRAGPVAVVSGRPGRGR